LTNRDPAAGVVLFMVLILSTMMFLLVSTLLIITMTEVHLAKFEQRSTQAFYAAESGITLGVSKLRENYYHRTVINDTLAIGGDTSLLTVEFQNRPNSLYHLVLQGQGSVPGVQAAVRRTVTRQVVLKPFILFARDTLKMSSGIGITGNVHGNSTVTMGAGTTIDGDLTSTIPVIDNGGTVNGQIQLEPEIPFPELSLELYYPTYRYNGGEYTAKPLVHDIIPLSAVDDLEPPAPVLHMYSGFPDAENPAGVFYPASSISGELVALQVDGTVVLPTPGSLALNGIVHITPVDNFPALISAKDLNLNLIGNLDRFSPESLEQSQIQGVVYVSGALTLTGNNTGGELVNGSLLGHTLRITGLPFVRMRYDPTLFSDPPPGIDFLELGPWREVFE
jgi:hypothetical protein